jgi:hypothetical protein
MPPKKQNRFYVRLASQAVTEVPVLRRKVAKFGRVRDCGFGTAKEPSAAWFEVEVKDEYLDGIRRVLRETFADRLQEATEVDRGEGRLQAKQLNLFAGV